MIFSGNLAFGQKGIDDGSPYGHGQDSLECIKNLSLFYEFYKHKNYNDAIVPWREIYKDCPASREYLYAYGIIMFKDFIAKTNDAALKSAYTDTIMLIHTKRIKYFGDEGTNLGRQGIDLLRLRRTDGPEFVKQGYELLKKSIEIEKEKSSVPVLSTYLTSGIVLFMNKMIENEQLINDYILIREFLDVQLKKSPSSDTKEAIADIDKNIKESKVLTCEAVIKIFSPKYEASKDDLAFLKLVSGFMKDAQCEGEVFFATLAERLYQLEPAAESAYNLGYLFFKKEDYEKAKSYYLEAIKSSTSDENKAKYYYELGIIYNSFIKQPRDAVESANNAISLKPAWGDPYLLLGQAYILGKNSFKDNFEQETVFWVAVDMFQKAKSLDPSIAEKANNLINEYSRYFPTKEDVFFRTLAVGQPYNVGGWINKTTTVRAR